MLNRQPHQKKSRQFDWLVVGVIVIFALVLLTAFLLFILYSKSKTSPVPMVEASMTPTTINTATITFTPPPQATLVLPSSTPQVYIVKQGDTLYGIAETFGITVGAIKVANALTSDTINIDQPLFIPASQLVATSPAVTFANTLVVDVTPDYDLYQVLDGDTLENIAVSHGLDVKDLRAANAMIGDTLITGQFITIPSESSVAFPPWKFSIINGDFNLGYPLSLDTERFILHYQPNTFPAQDPNALAQLEMNGLDFVESLTGLRLESKYDVYAAGSNFEPPNRALRGITFSSFLKTFFLHNGTGNLDDQQYIITHELTHLFFWNTVGSPASTMLSEGTAVYSGMEMIKNSEHMPIDVFCAAYLQAGVLPNVSGSLSFLGHISDLENYYSAGSFVKYLVDVYGIESLKLAYHSGDYTGVYGKSLTGLENDWRIYLTTVPIPDELNPTELANSVTELGNTYVSFFSGFSGNPAQFDAYRELDNARIALLQGRLIEMRNFLEAFKEIR